jgi:PAS domain S-box-containing protein
MEELGFREANLNHSKIMSMSAMASIDKKVSGTTKLVNDSIEKTILSSGAAVLVLSIIVMIILGLTTTYLIRSNINNPMKIILKGIESFRKGKFDTQMEPGRKDEWGTIEKAFNNMASDLSRSYDELEQRVNERTAELTNVNKEMEAEIEERKRIEEALQKSEEKYRTILQSIEDGYFEVDIAGNFTFFNDATCKLLQYSKNELMGMNNRQYMDKENAKKVFKVFNQVYITGKPSKGFDYEIIKKDGSKGHIEVSVSLIKDSEGQSIGFRVLARDITERKQAEREKKKLEIQFQHVQKMEAIGTLASGVAHDFNNLLTTISMSAELALIKFVKDNRLRTIIEDIKKATQRGASLTSQLLAFSRRQVIRPNVLNLNEGLRDIGKMLERLIGEDIELNVVTDPGLWNVKADPGQIDQVIMNLSINARDAMPKGGKLTIETSNVDLRADYFRDHGVEELPGPYVMLAVSDTGLGIDKKTESHIFEPFFTTKEKGKGTGLGLSTVYGIIKQSGGYIWVYSEPGQGSTFKVYLPKWEGDSDSGKKGLKPIGEVRGSETVLIVEDDDMLRNLAKKILHLYGYMGLEARDGNDALRVSEEYKGSIQLMVTDVVMPEMSGRELADRIQPLRPEMKILYMSGYTDNAIVHHQVLDPHLAFLQKPFTPEGLAGKVREVLDA